ncbi:MAG: hypothetical protein WC784_03380 [Candidatus Shapirobacteria bacterium]|jgi:hypothetical protein
MAKNIIETKTAPSYQKRRFFGTPIIDLEPDTIVQINECGNIKNLTVRITQVVRAYGETIIGVNKLTEEKNGFSISKEENVIVNLPVKKINENNNGRSIQHYLAYFPQENSAIRLGQAGEGDFINIPKIRIN